MSFRSFSFFFCGFLTNLWIVWATLTPIIPTTYHQLGPGAPRSAGLLPAPGGASRVPVRGVAKDLRGCFVFGAGSMIGVWNPGIGQALAADSAVADFLLGIARYQPTGELDSILRAMRNDARQVLGVDRFVEGRGYLIIGYEPGPGDGDRLVTRCADPRWRWSIEFTPGSGFHHFSLFRDQCEDPPTPLPTVERSGA